MQEEAALKREQAAFDAELRVFEMERRMELEAAKIAGNLDLAQFKAETEARLAVMKAQIEAALGPEQVPAVLTDFDFDDVQGLKALAVRLG